MVGDPVFVVGGPLVPVQGLQTSSGSRSGAAGIVGGELPPAGQGGQLPASGRLGSAAGRAHHALVRFREGVEDRHRDHLRQRRVLRRPAAGSGRRGRAARRRPWSPAGAAAFVRAATRRSRLLMAGFSWSPRARRSRGGAAPRRRRRSPPRWPRGRGRGGRGPRRARRTGRGARFRCFQNAVIQPSGPRTWMRETS